jgi:hypothetical protein
VADFPHGPRQLAEYLKKMDQNSTIFNQYFDHHAVGVGYFEEPSTEKEQLCQLCQIFTKNNLLLPPEKTKSKNDLDQIWQSNDCESDEILLNWIHETP